MLLPVGVANSSPLSCEKDTSVAMLSQTHVSWFSLSRVTMFVAPKLVWTSDCGIPMRTARSTTPTVRRRLCVVPTS
jgi:hypothetical protein